MVKSCIKCAIKHVSRANGYLDESLLGYPVHRCLAIGELSLAESELLETHIQLAEYIRGIRVKMLDDDTYQPYLLEILEMLTLAKPVEIPSSITT